jgi:hypothetical protein
MVLVLRWVLLFLVLWELRLVLISKNINNLNLRFSEFLQLSSLNMNIAFYIAFFNSLHNLFVLRPQYFVAILF